MTRDDEEYSLICGSRMGQGVRTVATAQVYWSKKLSEYLAIYILIL